MPADIDTKHLLFKGKEHLLWILPNIRKADIKLLLFFCGNQVKKTHLSCHVVLPVLHDMIHDLSVSYHKLFSGTGQTVKSPGLDKVLNRLFVDLLIGHTADKILQIQEFTVLIPLLHNSFDHRPSHALDCCQCIADGSVLYRKAAFSLIDVRRQDADPHTAAHHNIFCHLSGIINHRSHKRRHKFYRIVIFQVSCLIGNHRITGRMGLIKCIFGEIHHVIIDSGSYLL